MAALRVGLVMAVGVVSVLVVAGLVVSLGLRIVITIVPWLAAAMIGQARSAGGATRRR